MVDIKRPPKSKIKKRLKSAIVITVGLIGIGGITYGLTKLKPELPRKCNSGSLSMAPIWTTCKDWRRAPAGSICSSPRACWRR